MSQRRRKTHISSSQPQPSTSRGHDTFIEEDDDVPGTQPHRGPSNEEIAHDVANTVKYILAADQSKVPITKANISKQINCQSKHFKSILHRAEAVLADVSFKL